MQSIISLRPLAKEQSTTTGTGGTGSEIMRMNLKWSHFYFLIVIIIMDQISKEQALFIKARISNITCETYSFFSNKKLLNAHKLGEYCYWRGRKLSSPQTGRYTVTAGARQWLGRVAAGQRRRAAGALLNKFWIWCHRILRNHDHCSNIIVRIRMIQLL